jgi:hypothetical protein
VSLFHFACSSLNLLEQHTAVFRSAVVRLSESTSAPPAVTETAKYIAETAFEVAAAPVGTTVSMRSTTQYSSFSASRERTVSVRMSSLRTAVDRATTPLLARAASGASSLDVLSPQFVSSVALVDVDAMSTASGAGSVVVPGLSKPYVPPPPPSAGGKVSAGRTPTRSSGT